MKAVTPTVRATATHAVSDYYVAVQKIYLSYFGRPADYSGMVNFATILQAANAPTDIVGINAMYNQNAQIRAAVDNFATSQESQQLYPGADTSTFLDAVYQNLFNRAPDADGKAFWANAINSGSLTRSGAGINIMAGAVNGDITTINNKATVGLNFTNALNTYLKQHAYAGINATLLGRQLLAAVSGSSDPTSFGSTISGDINTLLSNAPPLAEGAYRSALTGSGNNNIDMIVTDDDQVWGLYGVAQSSQFVVTSFVQGQGLSGSGSYSVGNLRDFGATPPINDNMNTTFSPGTAFNGTIGTPQGNVNIAGSAMPTATYNYGSAPKFSDVAGAWVLNTRGGKTANVTVAADGTFSGTSNGCSFTGSLTPRSSGKNLFNASIQFGAAPCDPANTTESGIALTYQFNGGATRQLIIAVILPDRSNGTFFSGSTATAAGQVASLSTVDLTLGAGAAAVNGSMLTVNYSGYYYTANTTDHKGAMFDSGSGLMFQLGAGRVIDGWDEGLPGMRVGGTRRLIVPASLAYGSSGTGTIIPPNAALVFDIDLVAVSNG